MLKYSFVGSAATVRRGLEEFTERTAVEELMVVSAIFDHAARLRSYELLASVLGTTPGGET
jgi:alkanesulfonate monooxygenase SsuD/methylene tetrahydromethanopterin reductase-like flavin-dependent oxidoreductase (luciferase family)